MILLEKKERMVRISFGELAEVYFLSQKDGRLWSRAGTRFGYLARIIEPSIKSLEDGLYSLEVSIKKHN